MYAIRQKSTGFYLPQYRRRRSPTHTEPSETEPPRLFESVGPAKKALNWWLLGWTSLPADTRLSDWCDEITTKKLPHRKTEDMQIVRLKMVVAEVIT
jgi:hypothetical protein|tara:strand:+ start:238 stop:528 length:291 start_codon:yes stop_codon:yes gene_type:complete